MATVNVDVEIDLAEFDDEEIIEELKFRGYKVVDNNQTDTEIIKTDLTGCKIIANGKTYEFDGLVTVVVQEK